MDASSYSRLLQDPQFTVAPTVEQIIFSFLSFLSTVTKSIQAKDCNIAEAYHDVALARECIRDARKNICCERVWKRIEQVATSVNVTMVLPRTPNVQYHRANAAVNRAEQSPSDYYKGNVYYSFIDHVIVVLDTRFFDNHKGLMAAQYLMPVHLNNLTESQFK